MKPELRNILLDLDGTLTDSAEGIIKCLRFALGEMGREVPEPEELTWCLGPPFTEVFPKLLGSHDKALIEKGITIYRSRYVEKGMFENCLYPGVADSLDCMKKAGLRLFLATSKPRPFAEIILKHFDLTGYFQKIYGSELDGSLHDKADMVAHILEKEGLDPAESVMVGDRMHDVRAGRANGLLTVLMSYGYADAAEVESCRPDFILDGMDELADFAMGNGVSRSAAEQA